MAAIKGNFKVLSKLFDNDLKTEDSIKNLRLEDIVKTKGFVMEDLGEIVKLQNAIKKGKVISYLSGELEVQQKEEDADGS